MRLTRSLFFLSLSSFLTWCLGLCFENLHTLSLSHVLSASPSSRLECCFHLWCHYEVLSPLSLLLQTNLFLYPCMMTWGSSDSSPSKVPRGKQMSPEESKRDNSQLREPMTQEFLSSWCLLIHLMPRRLSSLQAARVCITVIIILIAHLPLSSSTTLTPQYLTCAFARKGHHHRNSKWDINHHYQLQQTQISSHYQFDNDYSVHSVTHCPSCEQGWHSQDNKELLFLFSPVFTHVIQVNRSAWQKTFAKGSLVTITDRYILTKIFFRFYITRLLWFCLERINFYYRYFLMPRRLTLITDKPLFPRSLSLLVGVTIISFSVSLSSATACHSVTSLPLSWLLWIVNRSPAIDRHHERWSLIKPDSLSLSTCCSGSTQFLASLHQQSRVWPDSSLFPCPIDPEETDTMWRVANEGNQLPADGEISHH